jgi:16S rRNA (guanine966-N2)-methyltransferase
MRIVAGAWRGRVLRAPPGDTTRPTADRVRQALFDMLLHAPWGGRESIEGARVLDLFAGTGALGLEALSRGAAFATFIEHDRAALAALRANVAMLGTDRRCAVLAADALTIGMLAASSAAPCSLIFLDPPYGADMVPRALGHMTARGWIAPGALIVAETARDESPLSTELLAERIHGAARISIWRAASSGL